MALQQPGPHPHRPAQRAALDDGGGGAGIVEPGEGLGDTEQVARIDHADDDLLSLAGHLRDPQPAADEDEEVSGLLALLEDHVTRVVAAPGGGPDHLVEVLGGERGEELEMGDLFPLDLDMHGARPHQVVPSRPVARPGAGRLDKGQAAGPDVPGATVAGGRPRRPGIRAAGSPSLPCARAASWEA
jgi:hypothetical protein